MPDAAERHDAKGEGLKGGSRAEEDADTTSNAWIWWTVIVVALIAAIVLVTILFYPKKGESFDVPRSGKLSFEQTVTFGKAFMNRLTTIGKEKHQTAEEVKAVLKSIRQLVIDSMPVAQRIDVMIDGVDIRSPTTQEKQKGKDTRPLVVEALTMARENFAVLQDELNASKSDNTKKMKDLREESIKALPKIHALITKGLPMMEPVLTKLVASGDITPEQANEFRRMIQEAHTKLAPYADKSADKSAGCALPGCLGPQLVSVPMVVITSGGVAAGAAVVGVITQWIDMLTR